MSSATLAPPAEHEMAVLDETGHTRIIWDPRNEDEVENARRTFKDLRKKGYLAYKVQAGGEQGEAITEFDPQMEKLILAPATRGG